MTAAYDALPDDVKRKVEGRSARRRVAAPQLLAGNRYTAVLR
jgi:hypothetical protein